MSWTYFGDLFIFMMERVGLIVLLAVLLVQTPYFKNLLSQQNNRRKIIPLVIVFGLFAILSNLTGIKITPNNIETSGLLTHIKPTTSIANTRSLAISVSGFVGGPIVGGFVGIIAGLHRVFQGNGGGLFYCFSSPIIGCLAGLSSKYLKHPGSLINPNRGFIAAAILEGIQLLFIAIFTPDGLNLIRIIALPMLILNSVGTFIFISTIHNTLTQEEQARAIQTHDVLSLATKTLPLLRTGLTPQHAQELATIIKRYTKVSAVSITDKKKILAHVGAGIDHHFPTHDVITELSLHVIETGKMAVAHNRQQIGCTHADCPLQAAIVIPLLCKGQILGTLKLYFIDSSQLSYVTEQLAKGLAAIFSMQIELGEAQLHTKLLQDAEIKSLQAQINPHFFFNIINTILAIMRFDHQRARDLLLQLTVYFRHNLQSTRETTIPISDELEHLHAYLSLTEARFPGRYTILLNVDDILNQALVPPLCVQILVENAIRHAFGQRKTDNHIYIDIHTQENTLTISVNDNGNGISPERLKQLGHEAVYSEKGTGTALDNLSKRLHILYGEKGQFKAESIQNVGTRFTLNFPLQFAEGSEINATHSNS